VTTPALVLKLAYSMFGHIPATSFLVAAEECLWEVEGILEA